jgi:hypothetical protein
VAQSSAGNIAIADRDQLSGLARATSSPGGGMHARPPAINSQAGFVGTGPAPSAAELMARSNARYGGDGKLTPDQIARINAPSSGLERRIEGGAKGLTGAMAAYTLASTLHSYAQGNATNAELAAGAAPTALIAAEAALTKFAPNTLSSGASKALGAAGIALGAAFPLIEASKQEDQAAKDGDGYAYVVASTRGNYRAVGAIGSGLTGAAAGSVAPAYGTVTGFAVGTVGGIIIDEKANELAIEAASKDPEKLAQAAKLQAEYDKTVHTPKIAEMVKKSESLVSATADKNIETYSNFHIQNGTAAKLAEFDKMAENAKKLYIEGGIDKDGKQIYAGDKNQISKVQSEYEKISKEAALASPFSAEDTKAIVALNTEVDSKLDFLNKRPVPQNDPEAQATRQALMEKLNQTKEHLKPALIVIESEKQIASKANATIDMEVGRLSHTANGMEGGIKYLQDKTRLGPTGAPGENIQAEYAALTSSLGSQRDLNKQSLAMRDSMPSNQENAVNTRRANSTGYDTVTPKQQELDQQKQSTPNLQSPNLTQSPAETSVTEQASATATQPKTTNFVELASQNSAENELTPIQKALAEARLKVDISKIDQSKTSSQEIKDGTPVASNTVSAGQTKTNKTMIS